jgi:hypothetical protein
MDIGGKFVAGIIDIGVINLPPMLLTFSGNLIAGVNNALTAKAISNN